MTIKNNPRVGVGVIIIKDNMVLLGKRINSHGQDTWCPPGGHLEFGESFEECARRELLEETGLYVGAVSFYHLTNDVFFDENRHYITIFMVAEYIGGDPEIMEPMKCESWQWFSNSDFPDKLFLPFKNLIDEKLNFNSIFATQ